LELEAVALMAMFTRCAGEHFYNSTYLTYVVVRAQGELAAPAAMQMHRRHQQRYPNCIIHRDTVI
jgi:hypothetical protein